MATVQLTDLPIAASVADADVTHIKATGIDKQVTKAILLQDIQAEVDTNTTDNANRRKTLPLTGGGSLVVGDKPNELQDGGTYLIPLANTVTANTYIDIELTDTFSAFEPLIQRSGGDDITYAGGIDINYLFDAGSQMIRLTSNGVDEWRL